ncbi:Clr5 domain-containing protein [Triangularia setosa]|uniref:Clr5 domain-containing protein n=1 Tax=Triangularia setosa TaxID=2587417 RepID=A0AAN7A529_9PEZI|nr:Clr5 domain-containing protein [Podospora setosa]
MPPSGHRIDWEAHRTNFEDLYVVQHKSLAEVMEIMKEEFNVDATTKMYKKRIKAWGLFKNINGDQMLAMIRIREHRRKQGKRTQFCLRGKPVLDSKLRRFATRHGVSLNDEDFSNDLQAPLNGITFSTPEPDDHHESTTLRHDDTLHLSPVTSDADSTSLECFMSSPSTEPHQFLQHDYPVLSWDMPVPLTAGCLVQDATPFVPDQYLAGTAYNRPTEQQVYAWLDDGHLSRFDGYHHSTGHSPPLLARLEIGHETVTAPDAQSVPYEQHLETHQTAGRSPKSLEPALPFFSQAPVLSWHYNSHHGTGITNDAALTRNFLSEGMNPNLTTRDGTRELRCAAFQGSSSTLAAYTEHESINYAGRSDDDLTGPS